MANYLNFVYFVTNDSNILINKRTPSWKSGKMSEADMRMQYPTLYERVMDELGKIPFVKIEAHSLGTEPRNGDKIRYDAKVLVSFRKPTRDSHNESKKYRKNFKKLDEKGLVGALAKYFDEGFKSKNDLYSGEVEYEVKDYSTNILLTHKWDGNLARIQIVTDEEDLRKSNNMVAYAMKKKEWMKSSVKNLISDAFWSTVFYLGAWVPGYSYVAGQSFHNYKDVMLEQWPLLAGLIGLDILKNALGARGRRPDAPHHESLRYLDPPKKQ